MLPTPTVERPTRDQLEGMLLDAVMDTQCAFPTSDGCEVEPDGRCEHGHPTWLRRYGLI